MNKQAGSSTVAHDMGHRKRAEEAVQLSEGECRTLVDHLPDVVWAADAHGQPFFVSSHCKQVSGYAPSEICQPGFWLRQIHPGDFGCVRDGYRALFEEGRAFDVEYRIRRQDGEWIWVHDRAVNTYEVNGKRHTEGLIRSEESSVRKEKR